MKPLFLFFKRKEKRKNYFELPSKTQKRILNQTAKGTSAKKEDLLKKYSLRFSN